MNFNVDPNLRATVQGFVWPEAAASKDHSVLAKSFSYQVSLDIVQFMIRGQESLVLQRCYTSLKEESGRIVTHIAQATPFQKTILRLAFQELAQLYTPRVSSTDLQEIVLLFGMRIPFEEYIIRVIKIQEDLLGRLQGDGKSESASKDHVKQIQETQARLDSLRASLKTVQEASLVSSAE